MIHLLGWGRTPSSLSLSLLDLVPVPTGRQTRTGTSSNIWLWTVSIYCTDTNWQSAERYMRRFTQNSHKKSCWYKTAVVNIQLQVWATYNSRFNLNNLQILLNQMKKKKTTNELWPWRLRTCLCVWVSPKIQMCNFDPKKMWMRGKWKADTIKGNAWLPWEWFLADCLPAGV